MTVRDMKVLIWDFDNTLGRRVNGWSGAVLDALNASGIDHGETRDSIRTRLQSGFPWHEPMEIHGTKTYRQWWNDLARSAIIPCLKQGNAAVAAKAEQIAGTLDCYYLRTDAWELLPGARDALVWCRAKGYTNAMLTNNAAGIQRIFEYLDIDRYFEVIVNSADTGIEKPHPNAFVAVFEYCYPEKVAYMIGDSLTSDLGGACVVGIPTILVGAEDDRAVTCLPGVGDVPGFLETVR